MKQRNFVAKYSQRSGAGKHKEKPMRDYNHDYWNDADYDTVDYTAVEQYEERIAELTQTIEDMKTDELYILYHLMKAKDTASTTLDLVEVYVELQRLIGLHSKELQEKAKLYKEGL
jgi:hypothetical protein